MKYIKIILILTFCSTLLYGANQKRATLIVTVLKARIYKKPSAFTRQVGRLVFGAYVNIDGLVGQWVKVSFKIRKRGKTKKIKGYIHMFSLIDELHFRRQAESLKIKRNREMTRGRGVKCFDEEDEVASATKGFSEEYEIRPTHDDSDLFNDEEVAATTKGFINEEDELTAAPKGFSVNNEFTSGSTGFNRDVEKQYRKKHQKYRYDLVDKIDQRDIPNLYSWLKPWWKKAKLGKYGPYNPYNKRKNNRRSNR